MHQNTTSQNPSQLPAAQAVAGGSYSRTQVELIRAEGQRLRAQAARLNAVADAVEARYKGRK